MSFESTSKKLAASALLLAVSAGLAFAEDAPKAAAATATATAACGKCCATKCKTTCETKCEKPECEPPPINLMDGFYVGANFGYNVLTAETNIDEFARVSIRGNHYPATTGWNGGLFGGYGRYFDSYYIGAEVWGNWSNASQTFTAVTPRGFLYNKIRANWAGGIGILPGVALNCGSLGYFRLGYEWSNIDSTRTLHINTPRTIIGGRDTNNRNGVALGAGIETQILCTMSIRADFIATIYSKNSIGQFGSRVRLIDNRWTVGVLWHLF